jgi:hypothetical protein
LYTILVRSINVSIVGYFSKDNLSHQDTLEIYCKSVQFYATLDDSSSLAPMRNYMPNISYLQGQLQLTALKCVCNVTQSWASLRIQWYFGEGSLAEGRERGSHRARIHRNGVTRVAQLQNSQHRRDPTCFYNSL